MSEFVTLKDVKKIYRWAKLRSWRPQELILRLKRENLQLLLVRVEPGKPQFSIFLAGMDTASEGQVLVDGQDIATYSTKQLTAYRRDDIGFVFQFYNLIPNLTALENVELALQICKNPIGCKRGIGRSRTWGPSG